MTSDEECCTAAPVEDSVEVQSLHPGTTTGAGTATGATCSTRGDSGYSVTFMRGTPVSMTRAPLTVPHGALPQGVEPQGELPQGLEPHDEQPVVETPPQAPQAEVCT